MIILVLILILMIMMSVVKMIMMVAAAMMLVMMLTLIFFDDDNIFLVALVNFAVASMLMMAVAMSAEAINNKRFIAVDRGGSWRIFATTKFDVLGGFKGRQRFSDRIRSLLLIASGKYVVLYIFFSFFADSSLSCFLRYRLLLKYLASFTSDSAIF